MDTDSKQLLMYYNHDIQVVGTEAHLNSLRYDRNLIVPSHQSSTYNYNLLDQIYCYPELPDVTELQTLSQVEGDDTRTYKGLLRMLSSDVTNYVNPLDAKLDFVNQKIYEETYDVHRLAFVKFVVDMTSGIITNSLDLKYVSYFEGKQHYRYPDLLKRELAKYLPKVLVKLVLSIQPSIEDELEDLRSNIENKT